MPFHQKSEKHLIGGFHQSFQIPADPPCKHQNSTIWKQQRIQLKHNFSTQFVNNINILGTSADNSDVITPELVIKGHNNSPQAIQTKLGWTIPGWSLLNIIIKPRWGHFTLSSEVPNLRRYRRHVHASFGPPKRSKISSFPLINRLSRKVRIRPPCHGAKCWPKCANHALQTGSKDYASGYPSIQRLVHEKFHVGNFYLSTDTISEAIQHMEYLHCELQKGGFNLTKWVSTNETFLTPVPAEHQALSPANIAHA